MSWAVQLKKENGEVKVASVSGINSMPDFVNLNGHKFEGPGSSGDTVTVSTTWKAPTE